jgi:REP element-mobilizing transposase RayT
MGTKGRQDVDPAALALQDPRSLPFSLGRSRGRLPIPTKLGGTYFITYCLRTCGRIAASRDRGAEDTFDPDEIARMSEPPTPTLVPTLGIPRIARVVESSLLHFQGQRYTLHSWCVMPDHVHALVTPDVDRPLETIVHSWKSFTAHEVNRMLHRSGPLWQRECFAHLVRSAEAFERFLVYVEANPVTAGLCDEASGWPFSSARHRKALLL